MSLVNAVLTVIATWWVGTAVVLYLQQRIQVVGTSLVLTLTAVALSSIAALKLCSLGMSTWQSYGGFTAAIVLWGCLELSYFTGLVSGVHKRHCPQNCNNSRRFRLALGASIWHEISVVAAAALVIALCASENNPTGLYTFAVLWLMRWSAKLNLFWGVPNFSTDWFPQHLAYVHSYMRRSPVSVFFPLSVLLATAVSIRLMMSTLDASPEHALSTALPCVLLMLAILEHLFMALPIADTALWNKVFTREYPESDTASAGTAFHGEEAVSKVSLKPVLNTSSIQTAPANQAAIPTAININCVKSTTAKPLA
ncbi:MAG: putative photosynthetic complex assembly protein PuhE [Granulosicoccus sp.]